MTLLTKCALLGVVFVDLMGQGLFFPIVNTLVMDPGTGFLPKGTSEATRHISYGLVIGSFFLAWFFGAPYISRLSDVFGRRRTILFCLAGTFAGYVLTIVALSVDSLTLLIVGRVVTGFTAGNQPIAQAALIDGSVDEADRGRNMGHFITGSSLALVGGPLIGGIFSDPAILGPIASLKLPFYVALALVAAAGLLIVFGYRDVRKTETAGYRFRAFELIDVLLKVRRYPLVMRALAVLLFFHLANITFYVFISNYMASEFGFRTLGTSMVMAVIGVALAVSSGLLVVPAQRRFTKITIIGFTHLVWAACAVAIALSGSAIFAFVMIFCFYFAFGIAYPTMLSVFAATVGPDEQGWVMGITIAAFTAVGGVMSLLGGYLAGINIDLPFAVVSGAALIGIGVMLIVWRHPSMDRINRRVGAASGA